MKRLAIFWICVVLGGCVQRWVDPPPPADEGAFLVHVVRAPDESLPKILTWYTGTTLSQQFVIKYNPFLLQREMKIGDKIVIPIEVVANNNPYGTAPERQGTKVPNLLMGEGGPASPPKEGASDKSQDTSEPPTPQKGGTELPTMSLETFNDDTNPDAPSVEGGAKGPGQDDRVRQLQKEIAEKERELRSLQAPGGGEPGDEDMPPPGLVREFEGS